MACSDENLDRKVGSEGTVGAVGIFSYRCGVYIAAGGVIFHNYLEAM